MRALGALGVNVVALPVLLIFGVALYVVSRPLRRVTPPR